MTEAELRGSLVDAGLALVEKNLVARTWGNLSVRLDELSFLITPSGLPYESLTADDMVAVEYATLEHSAGRKPSSEKGLHAAVYALRPDVHAIVHTHQAWASAVAAARTSIPAVSSGPDAGGKVPCAAYALPTTKALVRSVSSLLTKTGCDSAVASVLLANHGALCFGSSPAGTAAGALADAVAEAERLEKRAKGFLSAEPESVSAKIPPSAVKEAGRPHEEARLIESLMRHGFIEHSWQAAFRNEYAGTNAGTGAGFGLAASGTESLFREAAGRIFRADRKRTVVVLSTGSFTVEVSRTEKRVHAYLDDFAQMNGPSIACVPDFSRVRRRFLSCPATLVRGSGCLCAADSLYDAFATAMVVEKNCLALSGGSSLGGSKRISLQDALLMRAIYAFKYSRQT